MREPLLLFLSLLSAVARLLGRGGAKALVAENLLIKQQLLVLARSRRRAPNLTPRDRVLFAFWSLFLRRTRFEKVAVALRSATLLAFHQALVRRKYQAPFPPSRRAKPGPKGPPEELIQASIELKRRNPCFGWGRIVLIIGRTFGVELDKDVVRRVLSKHYRPSPGGRGSSWLTFIGHAKDRCSSSASAVARAPRTRRAPPGMGRGA